MFRQFVPALLALCACGRSRGVADQDLGALVKEPHAAEAPIDVAKAATDPAELSRAIAQPNAAAIAVLGPHTLTVSSTSATEGTDLSEQTVLELGEAGAFHGVYTNSADYGRETTFIPGSAGGAGKLYLRPRYQRWHGRAPESPDEPAQLRDAYADAIPATWDLLAPGAELTDRGTVQIAGRAGRKIEVRLAPQPRAAAHEAVTQRKWRETRTVTALSGEVVLDAEKGVVLAAKLSGAVGFQREGKRYELEVSVDGTVASIGTAVAIAAPAESEVVATPERLREVDDRDQLLKGIAPPLRKPDPAPRKAP